jgi:hypothetical protein
MSFMIDFVGLAYFYKMKNSRLVLLPDGRAFDPDIDPHNANFYIEKPRLSVPAEAQDWWPPTSWEDKPLLAEYCLYEFPIPQPAMIAITGLEAPSGGNRGCWPGHISPIKSHREDKLEHLKAHDPEMKIVPELARTIARLTIGQGVLEVFSLPSGATVTRLTLPNHTGPVEITATTQYETKTLRVQNETEIVLANTSELFTEAGPYLRRSKAIERGAKSHFYIYEQLATEPDISRMKPPLPNQPAPDLPQCPSSHAFFVLLGPQTPGGDCGQGCC